MALLAGLDLRGWIITGDAKFAQMALVQKIIERHRILKRTGPM